MRQISLLKPRSSYRRRASDFTLDVLFQWRRRMQFRFRYFTRAHITAHSSRSIFFSPVRGIRNAGSFLHRPFSLCSRIFFPLSFFFFFSFVFARSVRACTRESTLSQIFTLDFLIFAEAMMREPGVSRDDYSE